MPHKAAFARPRSVQRVRIAHTFPYTNSLCTHQSWQVYATESKYEWLMVSPFIMIATTVEGRDRQGWLFKSPSGSASATGKDLLRHPYYKSVPPIVVNMRNATCYAVPHYAIKLHKTSSLNSYVDNDGECATSSTSHS